jgi:GT2 family glycosyltransferase
LDVYIVDNGSTDGTQDFIKRNYPDCIFCQSERNLGFGAANNLGLNYAIKNNYDYVYLLNQDAWIFEDTIPCLIAASEKNPLFGILSPIQMAGNEKTIEGGFRGICTPDIISAYEHKDKNTKVYDVKFVMAAHWFIPVSVVKEIGGFSPTFFHYGEDNNYVDRIVFHGYSVGIVPTCCAVHDRELRPTSREKLLYLKGTSNLIRLSNPNKPMVRNLLLAIFYSFCFAMRAQCFYPIKEMKHQLVALKTIRKNRLLSKGYGAFLDI